MGVSPQHVRTVEFRTVKKGLDPDEVTAFLAEVADDLERAQNQATAMEARARAAVQRVQELSAAQAESSAEGAGDEEMGVSVDEAETISRTLLLAQRTADTTLAEAEAEATSVREAAAEEATRELDAARELATQMSETARATAREAGEDEHRAVEQELHETRNRRDAFGADAEALGSFLEMQRERLRDAATTLMDLTERVPGGLAEVLPPLLQTEPSPVEEVATEELATEEVAIEDAVEDEAVIEEDLEPEDEAATEPDDDVDPDATAVIPAVQPQVAGDAEAGDPTPVDRPLTDDLRLRFTDES